MEVSLCRVPSLWTVGSRATQSKSTVSFVSPTRRHRSIGNRHLRAPAAFASVGDVAAGVAAEPGKVEITWQIIAGTIAGVTPFVVAGIEFSKRIIAQKRCEECGGSGLVLIEDEYCRCPQCGGFLPWQSWRRFFTG